MKKNVWKAFRVVGLALAACCITACSKDKEVESARLVDVGEKLQIVIKAENYQADKEVTRAAAASNTQTVELGDGLTAEMSLEADEVAPMRAGNPLPDGRYTIYPLNSAGKRIYGTDKTLTGTVTGGVFRRDVGSYLRLPHGTYTFVCYNGVFTPWGVDGGLLTHVGANAMIGIATETINSDDVKQVVFVMRHYTSRIRIALQTYVPFSKLTGEIRSTGSVPLTIIYDQNGVGGQGTLSGIVSAETSFSAPTEPIAGQLLYNSVGRYHHYLENTDASKLVLELKEGTVYGKAVNGKKIALSKLPTNLNYNTSYTLKIKLTSPGTYLYEDGSTGEWEYRGKRTAIGVVARQRSASQHGIAMALKDATNARLQWAPTMMGVQSNAAVFPVATAFGDLDGYKWTWEAQGSHDETTIKANEQTLYPPFYVAAHYNPGIATSGTVGKWYLPAGGEYQLFVDKFKALYPSVGFGAWNEAAVKQVFTKAGGVLNQDGWTSTENVDFKLAYYYLFAGQQTIATILSKTGTVSVRAFVHF